MLCRAATAAARACRRIADRDALRTPAGDAPREDLVRASPAAVRRTTSSDRPDERWRSPDPISSEMAFLGSLAKPGTVRINERLAKALPSRWVQSSNDGSFKLRLGRVATETRRTETPRRTAPPPIDARPYLPAQLRGLSDAQRGAGELKEVAMAFVRLDGTDDVSPTTGSTPFIVNSPRPPASSIRWPPNRMCAGSRRKPRSTECGGP